MDELEAMLNPDRYFRISRSFYVSVACIDQIHDYFGNRLLLHLKPAVDKEAIVSREKVSILRSGWVSSFQLSVRLSVFGFGFSVVDLSQNTENSKLN